MGIVPLLLCLVFGEDIFAKAKSEISPRSDFRLSVRDVTVKRDEEVGRTTCTVVLGVAWDSRLKPLLLQQGAASVAFAADATGKAPKSPVSGQGPSNVASRKDTNIKIQTPAPARSCPKIDSLKGELVVTTPSKMLEFSFDSVAIRSPAKKSQEGVNVTLEKVSAGPDRLSVELIVENPKGTPVFETFQTSVWLEHNTIHLVKGKETLVPGQNDEELLEALTPLRARIRYHFKHSGKLDDWRLVYRTPGPIVEVVVPFELKDIPLP